MSTLIQSKAGRTTRILFYTGIPRVFRSSLIGHLHRIAQIYPTVLLSEDLDIETHTLLRCHSLFPRLEHIIPVCQYTNKNRNLISLNRYLYRKARSAVIEFKPTIVIAPSDVDSLFEMYLLRLSKKASAFNVTISGSVNHFEMHQISKWCDLVRLHTATPRILPYQIRYLLTKLRKYLGHSLYYYLLPLMVYQAPFWGTSSYILHKGHTGMRDSDCHLVLSENEYNLYHTDGVPKGKLYIVEHPMKNRNNSIFQIGYFAKLRRHPIGAITIMLPAQEIGFRKDFSLLPPDQRRRLRMEVIRTVVTEFPDYHIYIKPHPILEKSSAFPELKASIESLSPNIEVVDPESPADTYIELGDIIIDLPLSASTTLFTALYQCPNKPLLSLDFDHEFLGDAYANWDGIEYVDDKTNFANILRTIRHKQYIKYPIITKSHSAPNRLGDILELIALISR